MNLSRPTLKGHPKMDALTRAAQFSPFAALTGHAAALDETAMEFAAQVEEDGYVT